ncbi:MAG: response regulator [Candidatus Lernaella stagnicola]|nr:response regulator [Candidatus Lernaella stagnicola]
MRDGKYVILCIDDDPDVLNVLRLTIEANGYAMEEAYSAEEGLKKYKQVRPDFVIVDLMMESIDAGRAFAKELIVLDNNAPLYMLSSVGNAMSQIIDAQSLGLDGILQKPIDPNWLLTLLREKLK